ncbi:MAG: CPBP family intramembrane glutamic endopeptidase [Nakamurella sp.]
MTLTNTEPAAAAPAVRSPAAWVRFLAGFVVLFGVLSITSAIDATGTWGLAILAAVLATAAALERFVLHAPLAGIIRRVGLGGTNIRSLVVAGGVSALILLVYPLSASISGAPMQLRSDWVWLLVGIYAFHGLAEEIIWRGYAFRRLRDGRSFRRAVLLTMPLIAATHIPIVLTLGPAVGLGAMLVAAVTTIPLSYLYEVGGNSVWAPGLLHTAIDAFKLFVIPAAAAAVFPFLMIAVSVLIPLLALIVPRRFFGLN